MKHTNLFYILYFFIFVIFVIIYFQWSYREGLANIDPSIVNSNVPNGQGLSNQAVLDMLNNLTNFSNKTTITKINIVANDNNSIVTAGMPNPGTLSLNGRIIGTIGQNIQMLQNALSFYTAGIKSIDIQYTTS
jgi:hypothetical protein